VVVVATIDMDAADTKEAMECFERSTAASTLDHNEAMLNLITGPVAASVPPMGLPGETDREASLSVYKTNDPADSEQPFLLVFRTDRIVTAHTRKSTASTGQILGFSSI
jgi:hypothetical protein